MVGADNDKGGTGMMWPFKRTEKRESSFTQAVVARLVAQAGGPKAAEASATGAVESASGLIGRCFASATVTGPAHLAAAVTPALLMTIGRALIRTGELVASIDVDFEGRVTLIPASDWDITGDHEEHSWLYRLNLPGPGRFTTRPQVPSTDVVHLRFQTDPARPWEGVGPLQSAALAGRLSAETVSALADAESGPRGSLLPLPVDGDDPTVEPLKASIRTLAGKLAFVESTRTMTPAGAANAPRGDWDTKRIGANPPAAEVELMAHATVEILSACGVPPALFAPRSDGTSQRESFRRLLHATIAPLGRVVSAELTAKLEAPIGLNFDALFAADLSGRARAFQSMVGGGMDVAKAAGLAGLMESE